MRDWNSGLCGDGSIFSGRNTTDCIFHGAHVGREIVADGTQDLRPGLDLCRPSGAWQITVNVLLADRSVRALGSSSFARPDNRGRLSPRAPECAFKSYPKLWVVANIASSRRLETPSLSKMLLRWRFTVSSLMEKCCAMSLLLFPERISETISSSRGVRP